MHAYLRRHHDDGIDPVDADVYGPSTSNQIERWWKQLHERMEKFYKAQLNWLKDQGDYDPHDETDRMLLAFFMVPLIQKELDTFRKTMWNTHRICTQKETVLPDGVPNHIFDFLEQYGLEQCGLPVTEEQLQEVAMESGVLDVAEDFLSIDFRAECERIIPDRENIKPHECKDAFLYLKHNFNPQNISSI